MERFDVEDSGRGSRKCCSCCSCLNTRKRKIACTLGVSLPIVITIFSLLMVWTFGNSGSGCVIPDRAELYSRAAIGNYTADAFIRMNQFQAISAHNTYRQRSPLTPLVKQWQYGWKSIDHALTANGARAIEFDVHWNDGWRVFHLPIIDDKSSCECLSDCLLQAREWSYSNNRDHFPLFISIEFKDTMDPYVITPERQREFDEVLLSVWPEEYIIKPTQVQGNYTTLREAIIAKGWPTLEETRGKVLLHSLYPFGKKYVGDLLFNMMPESERDDPEASIIYFPDAITLREDVQTLVRQNFIVIADTEDNAGGNWDTPDMASNAVDSGVNFLKTNFPAPRQDDYPSEVVPVALPGGEVVRCNPMIDNPYCTSENLESL